MEKSKKISFTSIAIVVLAILLTVSLTMGGTLAWFANQNQAGTSLTMGNAVGVAVVDNENALDSMDRLSFTFHTGANGELMLPGTQIDPNVRALIAKSNTNVILRAVVSFEVSLSSRIDSSNMAAFEAAAGSQVYYDTEAQRNFVAVPASVKGANDPTNPVQQELYLLNQMYVSFFETLQASALYNGWVYREANLFTGSDPLAQHKGSARAASSRYYVAGLTQYQDKPIIATAERNAGIGRTQQKDPSVAGDDSEAVTYNAFYFRGWQGTDESAVTAGETTGTGSATYDPATGNGDKYVDYGIDGIYKETYSAGSKTKSEYADGGRKYYTNRAQVAAKAGSSNDSAAALEVVTNKDSAGAKETATIGGKVEEYAIMEGAYNESSKKIEAYADPLGYRKDDPTAGAATDEQLRALNVSQTGEDSWKTSGVGGHTDGTDALPAQEDMMCVINSKDAEVLVPLFTTSFILPTTWTQDAFADRTMKLNITFQVMQADYLAGGNSHHCSVELAESRFDDATIWANSAQGAYSQNAPFIIDVEGKANYNNPDIWIDEDDYPYINDDNDGGSGSQVTPTPPVGG